MKAKKYRGLYFEGKVLDMRENRGRFNLYYTWTSGYIAGESLGK